MPTRARLFGSVAADYARYRLEYPPSVVDAIGRYTSGPLREAVEIGAGTGKATTLFTQSGIRVTATDPDDAMLDQLRQHVPASVVVIRASLEDLDTTRVSDLVYAAAALHWTDPAQRWQKVARLLRPDGTVAIMGGPVDLADPELAAMSRAARSPWLDEEHLAAPDGSFDHHWPAAELSESPLFTDVRQLTITRRPTVSSADYIGFLSTLSAYLQLSRADRRRALDAVADVLPERVDLHADIRLHLARRLGSARGPTHTESSDG
ncbi:class I SAM-dependent methyltransferase [Williamsia sterculiae]|uniref:Methyltransferase domain-containing protein n=1 Tax=Williamsia sterculiae TaxID=1344003 RepID=A0A1N7EKG1_9NOCA|nr:class I SAM-dependent methyltransferase [Williamsia sterculiae]SIR88567.1 Methyltransferase domain-containing protein [Williamsia sterculiae]